MKLMSQKMNNLRLPILFSSIFFLVFISSSFLFATPSFAARVGHSLVQEEVTKIPQFKLHEEPEIPEEPELPLPEEPELPLPEEPEIPEEPEVPEDPEEPEVPEEPEEPEEPPKEPEEPKIGFPSWIPSFPFPGVNGGSLNTEKTKPTETVEKVPAKISTSVSEETSSGSNKKP